MKHIIQIWSLLLCLGLCTVLSAQEVQTQKKVIIVTKTQDGDIHRADQHPGAHRTHVKVMRAGHDSPAKALTPGSVEVEVEMENETKHITIHYTDAAGEQHEMEWEGTGEPPAHIQQYLQRPPNRMKCEQRENLYVVISLDTEDELDIENDFTWKMEMENDLEWEMEDEIGTEVKVMVFIDEDNEMTEEGMVMDAAEEEIENVWVEQTSSADSAVEAAEDMPALPTQLQQGEPLSLRSLEFYPVPTSRLLQVKFSSEEQLPTQVSILDLQGRSVYQEDIKDFTGQYNNEIDLAGQAPGTYFLSIRQGDKIHTERILLQR